MVRNGYHRPRTVVTAAGPVEVKAPRVNDRRVDETTGERKRFSSKILPPWCRKSPKISEVLPLLYLHGLSSGDFVPALEQFLGSAAGLSPATVTRLTKQWHDDHAAFCERDLSDRDFVYVWADGVHPKVRLGQAHSCVLVLLGVRRIREVGEQGCEGVQRGLPSHGPAVLALCRRCQDDDAADQHHEPRERDLTPSQRR